MDSTAETGISMEIPEERLISMVSLVGSEVWTRRNALDWGAEASLRFHWKKNVGEQPIDWQNCATGALDRSHWAIRSAQILAVFGDAKRDVDRGGLRGSG